jgi:hypothetical protein
MILSFNEYLDKINEGLLKSYDIDFVIDKSLQRLSVLNIKFDIIKLPNNTIKLTLYNFDKVLIDDLFGLLNKNFTNLFGWYPSYLYLENLSGLRNRMNYDEKYLKKMYKYLNEVSIVYESKFDVVVNIPNKLYHLSIQEYEKKILTSGIVPKTRSKISSHGNRIYVCSNVDDCEDLIEQMRFYFFDKKKVNTKWIIYEINTENLELKLFKDSNYIDKGFYLLGNIPPNNINIIKKEN